MTTIPDIYFNDTVYSFIVAILLPPNSVIIPTTHLTQDIQRYLKDKKIKKFVIAIGRQ